VTLTEFRGDLDERHRAMEGHVKAWRRNESPEAPGLSQAEVEPPKPRPGELLIRVHAAGVAPVVESVVPFDQAGLAYTRPVAERRGCGKAVVAVMPPD
jgi:NADPH:quinone reductase-like Zn-dependent oxidoreductase